MLNAVLVELKGLETEEPKGLTGEDHEDPSVCEGVGPACGASLFCPVDYGNNFHR